MRSPAATISAPGSPIRMPPRHADEVERVVLLDANIPGVTLKPAIELGPDNWKSWHFLFNSVPDLPEALLRRGASAS